MAYIHLIWKNLNIDNIKFYLRLAEERLSDALDTKKQLDQKAFILFSGYMVATFALIGMSERFVDLAYWFNASAIFFGAGAVPLFLCIRTMTYGTKGRHPEDWLGSGGSYLQVKDKKMAYIYAYTLHDHIGRIDMSKKSNETKVFYLNTAIGFGLLSLAPFIIRLILPGQ